MWLDSKAIKCPQKWGNFTHRISINWIVARNCEYPPAIAHDHVLTLIHDLETSLSRARTARR